MNALINLSCSAKHILRFFLVVMLTGMLILLSACSMDEDSHAVEEAAVELTRGETYNRIDNGVRLVLSFNPEDNSFNGYVENITQDSLKRVSVEVFLSSGVELGPTSLLDLAPGERKEVKLFAKNFEFDSWTAHPEVANNSSENGNGEENSGGSG
jgi:hypothetical protein